MVGNIGEGTAARSTAVGRDMIRRDGAPRILSFFEWITSDIGEPHVYYTEDAKFLKSLKIMARRHALRQFISLPPFHILIDKKRVRIIKFSFAACIP